MLMVLPQVTLVLAAALAVVNLWLSIRVGQVRQSEKISVGDGGNDRVIRRMRAHANFGENAWLILVLVFAIEVSGGEPGWLWAATVAFVVGRIAHGFGMDGWRPGRPIGTGITMVLQVALAIWAVAIALSAERAASVPAVEMVSLQG
ncbi:MAG: GST-like protein [Sphingomonas bacterium]|uniref:MAPEG family protein n=1 Tax=Sphingomonas bacterium TaxID=1895847 RepID=UPI002A68525B|nr:GST-like protein [Sphingomonas bacterium]